MDTEDYRAMLQGLDREFELRDGFFRALMDQDDWSFVIKIHALLEAAITHLLVHKLGDARLQKVVERLPLIDEQFGKLRIAQDLLLLPKEKVRLVWKLAELRNQLAHKISNVNFSFADHLAALNKDQRKAFSECFAGWAASGQIREGWARAALEKPKWTIWSGTLSTIVGIQLVVAETKAERQRAAGLISLAETMIAESPELDPDFDPDDETDL